MLAVSVYCKTEIWGFIPLLLVLLLRRFGHIVGPWPARCRGLEKIEFLGRFSQNYEKRLLGSTWKNSSTAGRIFMKFGTWGFSENLSGKFKFHWNLTRITGTLHETYVHFRSHLAHFFLEWKMFQRKVAENIKTHILCSVTFSWKSCR